MFVILDPVPDTRHELAKTILPEGFDFDHCLPTIKR